jgi:hypothetical protein
MDRISRPDKPSACSRGKRPPFFFRLFNGNRALNSM